LIQQSVINTARSLAAPGEFVVPPDTPIGTVFFGFLAITFGTAGAVLGYQTWNASVDRRDF
jgi:hypothetical protein